MEQKNTVMILIKKKEVQVEIEILKVIFSIFKYWGYSRNRYSINFKFEKHICCRCVLTSFVLLLNLPFLDRILDMATLFWLVLGKPIFDKS